MKTINLREYYPDYYSTDEYIDVSDEVLIAMEEETRAVNAAERKNTAILRSIPLIVTME